MSEALQQTVVDEANAPAQQGAEVAPNARAEADDLDVLLNDPVFSDKKDEPSIPKPEQGATKAETPQAPLPDPAMSQILQRMYREDMQKTVSKVRGSLDASLFDDTLVEAWLDAQAREDPRLQQAWLNRHSNAKQFEKVVEGLGRSFAKRYGKMPDRAATEDREVVTAAVRGASTKAPEGNAPNFSDMNNAEYRETVKKKYGFDPGVG